ncbi:AraC family transcriptional regulator [Ruficoccus sp. ZRK36]|uniref:helix-turn-helix transcriptional regulator n=1 Tax=Ruficoccus sp. ZRK36 TaxID=2866311 RepID=UPI001C72E241|nr:AraC family transcriptional regulator [Ruficoccus sp. ZRK36]QYY34832.1 AraC family transcriptional regulator [Ruficoccus sp. ZRK36]
MMTNKTATSAWLDLAQAAAETPFKFITGWRRKIPQRGPIAGLHTHTTVEMVYHRSGSGVTNIGHKGLTAIPFSEGCCVVYAPGLPHDQVMDTPGEDVCVNMEVPHRIQKLLQGHLVIPDATRWISDDWDRLTSGKKPADEMEQSLLNLLGTAAILAMLRASMRASKNTQRSGEAAVNRADEYIRENFATIDNMQEVAEHAGLSHDRLRHLFREHREMSLITFLTRVRLERAKSLLTHSRLTLKEVASLCGFRDEYYFSNVFRKHIGQPPGNYRDSSSGRDQPPDTR